MSTFPISPENKRRGLRALLNRFDHFLLRPSGGEFKAIVSKPRLSRAEAQDWHWQHRFMLHVVSCTECDHRTKKAFWAHWEHYSPVWAKELHSKFGSQQCAPHCCLGNLGLYVDHKVNDKHLLKEIELHLAWCPYCASAVSWMRSHQLYLEPIYAMDRWFKRRDAACKRLEHIRKLRPTAE